MMLPNRNCSCELLLEQQVLVDEVAPLDRVLEHRRAGVSASIGFSTKLMRAGLHRLDRLRDAAVAGDDDDLGVGVRSA